MNIAQNVERAARLFPDRAAIIFERTQLTYRELNERASRLANALAANGVERGNRVALFLPNIPEFAVCYLAAQKVGAVAVSINSTFKYNEVQYIVNDSGAVLLFTVADLLPMVPQKDCPALAHVVVCAGDAQGEVTLDDWLAKGASDAKAADLHPDDPAVLLYTSGTTGFPKGATFTACATLVLHRRFVPDQVLDSIRREQITMFFAVPTIYISLLNLDLEPSAFSAIRYEFSAAATMPQEISRRWTERFGRPVYEGYGLTECSPFACYNHDFRHKFGSVGTAVENFELKILDQDDHELPLGQWGEICIRGPGVMKGYWGKPEDTASALRNGWLHSGDIGTQDDEGYVFIVDRVKDMINVSGFKVWPAEVEQVLYRHPAVQELAVYGVADPLKGEAVRAGVVLKAGATATSDEIVAYCREHMALYKAPESVVFLEQLPKSATGKILKRVLRAP